MLSGNSKSNNSNMKVNDFDIQELIKAELDLNGGRNSNLDEKNFYKGVLKDIKLELFANYE